MTNKFISICCDCQEFREFSEKRKAQGANADHVARKPGHDGSIILVETETASVYTNDKGVYGEVDGQ